MAGDSFETLEPKWLCVFLIDLSMGNDSLVKMDKELHDFHRLIMEDVTSRERCELCVATFGHGFKVLQKPVLVENFTMPMLRANNTESITKAVNDAVEKIKARKRWYKETDQMFYRPCLVLITNEAINELYHSDDFSQIREDLSSRDYSFLKIGMNGTNVYIDNEGIKTYVKDQRSFSQVLFYIWRQERWKGSEKFSLDHSENDIVLDDTTTGMLGFII